MGWQAGESPWPGGAPGQGESLPELLASFEHGGARDAAAPSAALVTALATAAGPDGLYDGAGAGSLVGIVRQWTAVESWVAAETLAALRAMTRENADGRPLLRRRMDQPDGWTDSLNYQIAGALAMGPVSAANLADLAWALGMRLPGIGRLLADGTLTKPKAKLIVATFAPLDEDEAARAEALIVGELKGKTWFQVERLAWRAALAVAPDVAERRRVQAEKRQARVTIFREESGTVGLSGRDLPTAGALAAHANVLARAREYQASGAFPDHRSNTLEALAYVHLLNGVSAQDAIAFARTGNAQPPSDDSQDEDDADPFGDGPSPDDEPGDPGDDDDPGGGSGPDDGPGPNGDGETGGQSDGGPGAPGGGPSDHDDDGQPDGEDGRDDAHSRDHGRDPDGDPSGDPGPDDRSGPDEGGGDPGGTEDHPILPEVTAPLATLQRRAERPGDNRLLGPLDPAQTRDLATAAARSPRSRWEITIVDQHGYAIGHGIARPARRRRRQEPQPPPGPDSYALPARVNITITQTLLQQLAAQPRPGAPPGDWELRPRTANSADGAWTLTLPGGAELTARFDVVPTHDCDHRYEVSSYQPGDRLRRLVQIRDHECTFPPCSRPAYASDFEHAIPYDKGGRTDACNAGARSRRCHQVKQSPGWKVTQPKPGWHEWTTPTGRTYTQEPWRYIA